MCLKIEGKLSSQIFYTTGNTQNSRAALKLAGVTKKNVDDPQEKYEEFSSMERLSLQGG